MSPDPQQPAEPRFNNTESLDSILVVIEGPGDSTRRPRRKNIPHTPPQEQYPPPEKKPEDDGPKAP
jgi:hypothetical protein